MTYQAADRVALPVKLLLVLCHNIICSRTIGVQIKAAFIQDPAGVLDLFQREIKKRTVVCLKLNASILYQKSVIPFQKLTGGQTAFCVPVLWPWI